MQNFIKCPLSRFWDIGVTEITVLSNLKYLIDYFLQENFCDLRKPQIITKKVTDLKAKAYLLHY